MRLKLRTKFAVPIILLFLIGMGLSSYITFSTSIKALESTIYEQTEQTAETINTSLTEWVARNKLDVKRWAQQDIFIDAIPESFLGKAARKAAFPLIKRIQNEYNFYNSIYLCNLKGKILVASSMDMEERTLIDEGLVNGVKQDGLVVSEIIKSPDTDEPVFIISAPVGSNNEMKGVLIGIVNFSYFTFTSVNNVRFGENGYVYILDGKQRIVAHPNDLMLFKPGLELKNKDIMGKYNKDIINVEKNNLALGLKIGITAPVEEILAPAKKIRRRVELVTMAVSIIVVIIVTLFIANFVTTPINQFMQSMKKVAEGDLDNKIHIETTDEFSKMALSFNEMANALKENKAKLVRKERMAALGELTARIAHEIKNPLSIIKGSAQILTDKSETPEIKDEVAQFVIEEVDHLSLRIQELLYHAKPMELQLEPLDMNQVLDERIRFWSSQKQTFKKVSILKEFDSDLPAINLDKRLIKQLAMNMIINACEAMLDGGTIRIITRSMSPRSQNENPDAAEPSGNILIFEDTGSGIDQDDIPKIFDPFFTTKDGGTGLGLSAVYRILEKHDATIEIKSLVGRGTRFTMKFHPLDRLESTREIGEIDA